MGTVDISLRAYTLVRDSFYIYQMTRYRKITVAYLLEEQDDIPVVGIPSYMIWEAKEDKGIIEAADNGRYENIVREGQDPHRVITAYCQYSELHKHDIIYILAETKYFRYRKFCPLLLSAENMEYVQAFLSSQCSLFLKRVNRYTLT